MLIPAVEDGLENYLRASLPLPIETGDISFEPPSSTWAAQVNRITVSCFLYDVSRSPMPPRPAATRPGPGGTLERRVPLPMVQLSYLVSAWAGSIRDEHQLLGDVLARLLTQQILPAEHLEAPLQSSVQIMVTADELNRPRDLWSGIGGTLKASFRLQVTVAADAYPWVTAPPGVTSVDGSASFLPRGADADPAMSAGGRSDRPRTAARRGPDGALHGAVPDSGS